MEKNYPAPWELHGEGYLMLFKFPKSFIMEHGFLPEDFKKGSFGNVGCIFFANYQTSSAGPYQELLFLPGKLRYQHRKLYSITKNYVSTAVVMENGLQNWGIPKELADFSFIKENQNIEHLKIVQNGNLVIDITIKTPGTKIPFPVSTFIKPISLVQQSNGKYYFTKVRGKGTGKMTQILKVEVNPELFPNFAFFKHVAIIKINPLQIKIPPAKVKENLLQFS